MVHCANCDTLVLRDNAALLKDFDEDNEGLHDAYVCARCYSMLASEAFEAQDVPCSECSIPFPRNIWVCSHCGATRF